MFLVRIVDVSSSRNRSCGSKFLFQAHEIAGTEGHRFFLGRCQIEMSPVNPDIIALGLQHRLIDRTGHRILKSFGFQNDRRLNSLSGHVGCPGRSGFEVELHIVRLPVGRFYLIGNIIDRTAHQVQVVHQQRSRKDHLQGHRSASKGIIGLRRGKGDVCLVGSRFKEHGIGHLDRKSEIHISAARRVVAVRGNHVLAFPEGSLHVGRQLQQDIVLPGVTGRNNLFPVDIEFKYIVVRIIQIDCLVCYVFIQVEGAAYPDIFRLPGRSQMRHLGRSESGFALLPRSIVEGRFKPVGSGFLLRVRSIPFFQLGRTQYRPQRDILFSHKTIVGSVDPQHTQQRERLPGPMPCLVGIQLIGKRPATGIRIDRDKRISRSPQLAIGHRSKIIVFLLRCAST